MARSSVDLPQPDSPTRPKVSPDSTENETARTASRRWLPLPNETTTSRMSITDVASGRNRPIEPGGVARKLGQLGASAVDQGAAGEQASRVRMLRSIEFRCPACLH